MIIDAKQIKNGTNNTSVTCDVRKNTEARSDHLPWVPLFNAGNSDPHVTLWLFNIANWKPWPISR